MYNKINCISKLKTENIGFGLMGSPSIGKVLLRKEFFIEETDNKIEEFETAVNDKN